MRGPRVHLPTVAGRLRTDRGLLLLVLAVVALTVALTGAVAPATERAADRAVAAALRDAGSRADVVATLPRWYDDPVGATRDRSTATQLRQDAELVRGDLPGALADVLQPGIVTVTSSLLQLLDGGPGRYLRLAYVDTVEGGPAVSYVDGRAPRAGSSGQEEPAVEVALSEDVARDLGVRAGDRVPARDEHGRAVVVAVSGTYVAARDDDPVWEVAPGLLHPSGATSRGEPRSTAAALVSEASLPDLRLALPGDAITRRVVFTPDPAALTWRRSASAGRGVAALQSGAGAALGRTTWDSLLGSVLEDARSRIAAGRRQADVLLVGLVTSALLVLVLAGQLLVRRRSDALTMARERGAALPDLAAELVVESVLVTAMGAVAGLAVARLTAGSVGWWWSVPVLLVAAGTPAVLGSLLARDVTVRVPANASARRARARVRQLRRLGLELAVVAATVLSLVALRQRGAGLGAGSDLTVASCVTGAAVIAALALLRVVPPAGGWALRWARRSPDAVRLLVAARLVRTATRVLPVTVVLVAVCLTTFGAALAATLRSGESAGALSVVGGDARLDGRPDPALAAAARDVAGAVDVDAAAAARIEDGVRVSARGDTAVVRLVVVDAPALEELRRSSDLADAPQLSRLRSDGAARVPALFLGASSGLRDQPNLRWEDAAVPLDAVGTAPDVDASIGPVVVVDADTLAAAGVTAAPDTVWAVGPGAADALAAVASRTPGATVVTYADELAQRREAALPATVRGLAVASYVLQLALALLGVALAASADAPGRRTSLGRLRALGASERDVRRTLLGELLTPVATAAVAGLAVGVACAHVVLGPLSLERLTSAPTSPDPVLSWWPVLGVLLLVAGAVALALADAHRLRRTPLAQLLRS